NAVRSLGSGLFVPFFALYLTGTLHASGAQAGALLGLAGGMGLVGAPLGGFLTDRLGRRPTLLFSVALGGVSAIAYGLAPNLLAILLVTPFFGISSDIESPAIGAIVADIVEPELRTEAYGLNIQSSNVFFAVGPPLGALLSLTVSLRWFWIIAGSISLVMLAVLFRAVPETRPATTEDSPVRVREALRDRLLVLLSIGTAIGIFVYVQFDSVLPVFLHNDRGYAVATWGAVFAINPILTGLVQYPIARWAGKRSPRAMLALGALVQAAAVFLLWPFAGIGVLIAVTIAVSVGEMILSPVASALAATLAPARLRGSYQAVVDLGFALSYMPGVVI